MVSVLGSSAADRGFRIYGVMVSVLGSSSADRGFRIYGVMVSVPGSSSADRGFKHQSDQPKEYKIGICWFVAKHA